MGRGMPKDILIELMSCAPPQMRNLNIDVSRGTYNKIFLVMCRYTIVILVAWNSRVIHVTDSTLSSSDLASV